MNSEFCLVQRQTHQKSHYLIKLFCGLLFAEGTLMSSFGQSFPSNGKIISEAIYFILLFSILPKLILTLGKSIFLNYVITQGCTSSSLSFVLPLEHIFLQSLRDTKISLNKDSLDFFFNFFSLIDEYLTQIISNKSNFSISETYQKPTTGGHTAQCTGSAKVADSP